MYKNIIKKGASFFAVAMMGIAGLTSCVDDGEDIQPYGDGEMTLAQILATRQELSAFSSILAKGGFDRTLSTYQKYTLFAPVNEGVSVYLDSLYADNNLRIPHNGIREAGSAEAFKALDVMKKVELMSDSLCKDLSKYHICGSLHQQMDITGGNTWQTLLEGRSITAATFKSGPYKGKSSLNGITAIVEGDIEATNGYLHICNGLIPRSDRTTDDEIKQLGDFNIFYEALVKTGLDKELQVEEKKANTASGEFEYYQQKPTDRENPKHRLWCPNVCKVKFTVFAETDQVFNAHGIRNFEDLKNYCVQQYQNCASWYDYVREHKIQISTGDDYTNKWNVVNMFIAYHILRAGMPIDKIVYEQSVGGSNWNIAYGYEPQEYFETMLPNTLMKIWQLDPKDKRNLYINRYRKNNTLTDELGTFGSEATHPIIFEGVEIDRTNGKSKETRNGYVHRLKDILVYNENAVNSQKERMRLDSSTFLYELINNDVRFATGSEISARNKLQTGEDNGARVAFDNTYFDNIVCYNPNTLLRFCVMGEWRANNSDQFQGWDAYDFAIKLPHVPTGQYELRIIYPPMGRGGLMQFYLGNSSNQADMIAQGIPFDACADPTLPGNVMGCEEIVAATDEVESDYGVESDQNMHVRGYMRAPASFSRGTYNQKQDKLTYKPVDETDIYCAAKEIVGSYSCRSEWGYGTMMLRRIICTQTFEQGKDYWLRIKNLVNDENLGWSFDFIELCPVSVANATDMKEDWY